MKKIRTVQGDISPEQLGYTSMHEHTLVDMRLVGEYLTQFIPPAPDEKLTFKTENYAFLKTGAVLISNDPANTITDDLDYMTKEVTAFKELGGQSIVDASMIGIRGNPDDIRKLSGITGVNIIMATGLYLAPSRPEEYKNSDVDFMISRFEKEINEGMDGTDVKPGILKCALASVTDDFELEETEMAAFMACAMIAANNGMSVHVHTASPLTADHILQAVDIVVEESGINPEQIQMCHMDNIVTTHIDLFDYITNTDTKKTVNTELQERLMDKGCNIGFDTFGSPVVSNFAFLPDDFDRMKALVQLIKKGYVSQITLGHDMCCRLYSLSYGNYGYTRFPTLLEELGPMIDLSENVIRQITVDNPARILAY